MGKARKTFALLITFCFLFTIAMGATPATYRAEQNLPADISGHWAEATIINMLNAGVIGGYPDGTFKPNNPITRAEFTTIVNKAFSTFDPGAEAFFTDVKKSDWYYGQVASGKNAGFISGFPDGSFRPNSAITREQATAILANLLQLTSKDGALQFSDANKVSTWARGSVKAVTDAKIISGYPDGTFKPLQPVTRAETVVIVQRALAIEKPPVEPITPSSLEVKVTANGKAVDKANINIFVDGTYEVLKTGNTDSNGILHMELAKGTYNITATKGRQVGFVDKVTVKDQGKTTAEIKLTEGVEVQGTLLDKNDKAVKNTEIVFTTNPTFISETDSAGKFKILLLPNKTYNILAFNPNKKSEGLKTIATGVAIGSKDETIKDLVAPFNIASTPGGGGGSGGGGGGSTVTNAVDISGSAIGVEGNAKVGVTLTAKMTLVDATVNYKWMRSDSRDGTYTSISGATGETYELGADDVGKYIKVRATGTGDYVGTVESEPIGPVVPEEYHTYKFKIENKAEVYGISEGLENPTDEDFFGLPPVMLSITVDDEKDKAYDGKVRVAPVNAEGLQLWAKDTNGNWHDINRVGWGPAEGFVITPESVTHVFVIATEAIDGTVTIKLVDVTGDYGAEDGIIISQEVAVKAVEPVEPTKPSLAVTGPGEEVSAEAENFKVTFVATHDKELAYLEIDHNLGKHGELPEGAGTLPEFKLYPDAENPWGSIDATQRANEYGVSATYDAASTTWEVTFGGDALSQIRDLTAEYTNKQFKIYSLVCDVDGIKSGSMYDGSYLTTVVEIQPKPGIIPVPGVSPSTEQPVSGKSVFTFGFKSKTGNLQELELDIYLGETTGANRNYADHLGINLPAGSDAVASWIDGVVEGYSGLDEKYHTILAAAGYVVGADTGANIAALKNNIYYTGDSKAGTWTIILDTVVLGEEKIEFLVTVKDDAGAKWGNNNFVAYPDQVKAYLYNVLPATSTYKLTCSELAESYTAGSLVDVSGKTQAEINSAVDNAISGMTPIQVTLATDVLGQNGYDAVRIAPVNAGSNVQLWAKDTNNNWYNINVVGWGPVGGFALPAQYNVTTPVYFLSDKAGDYTLNVKLVDVKNNSAVITEASATLTVISGDTAPTMTSLTATFEGKGQVTAENGTLTCEIGDKVTSIEVTLSEPVKLVSGTPEVTISGGSIPEGTPYGTISLKNQDTNEYSSVAIVTPYQNNETCGLVGTFTFKVAAGVVEDKAGNKNAETTFTLVVVDTAPTMTSLTATFEGKGQVTAENGTLTCEIGDKVTSIEVTLSEPVKLVSGTPEVTISGGSIPEGTPYGTISLKNQDTNEYSSVAIVTPYQNNETCGLVGTFTFKVAAGVVEDKAGNKNAETTFTLVVVDTAPTMTSLTATFEGKGQVTAENGTLTCEIGDKVTSIEVTLSEPVKLVSGTPEVTISGGSIPEGTPYGTISLKNQDTNEYSSVAIVTPYQNNETCGLVGTFTFKVAAGVVEDKAGNKNAETTFTLVVVDTTPPILESINPVEGNVNLNSTETFKLAVDAYDLGGLYELEVDHSFEGTLPEFSVYADENNPYGGQSQFQQAGVTVTYSKTLQKWEIDFGNTVTQTIVNKGGITFYLVIKDLHGNKWGSMYNVTPENTFVYTVTRSS